MMASSPEAMNAARTWLPVDLLQLDGDVQVQFEDAQHRPGIVGHADLLVPKRGQGLHHHRPAELAVEDVVHQRIVADQPGDGLARPGRLEIGSALQGLAHFPAFVGGVEQHALDVVDVDLTDIQGVNRLPDDPVKAALLSLAGQLNLAVQGDGRQHELAKDLVIQVGGHQVGVFFILGHDHGPGPLGQKAGQGHGEQGDHHQGG